MRFVAVRRTFASMRPWMGWAVGLACAAGFIVPTLAIDPEDPVIRYCTYGVVSEAQFEQCTNEVSASYFKDSQTNAAKYGRGEIRECRSDAGPYCSEG